MLCAFCAALPAQARPAPVPKAPQGLRAFMLRATESDASTSSHTFPRTPSFAWAPVSGAVKYEFELSTSKSFTDNGILWNDATLTTPVASPPLALPWITGDPYSLYAHVRAITRRGVTKWSAPYGFNVRWPTIATPMPSYPGLLRWTPVEGATQYNVWMVDAGKVFTTDTNVADERDAFSFHQSSAWTGVIHWRVRAERYLYGTTANGLPAISFGPWSPVYTSYNPPFPLGRLGDLASVSDTTSTASSPQAHKLMPGFAFTGNQSIWGFTHELYRVYVFTDRDCINMVYKGAIVGSPAYAPRPTGPLDLPKDVARLAEARANYLPDGTEGGTYLADGMAITTTEIPDANTPPPPTTGTTAPPSQTVAGAKTDLWDTDWPTGRYYWTVVGVNIVIGAGGAITYHDAELPQEACSAGRVLTFGKTSEPTTTSAGAPYVSGLSPQGRLAAGSARVPKFYGRPLVAWQPALGAMEYEVQWSKSAYPWKTAGNQLTFATSAVLPLAPGRWYYRVRGINFAVPGAHPEMTWSDPAAIVLTKPRYRVVR
jgi:hypothetical protein